MTGDNRYPGELPWGWWLRATGSGLQDGAGRTWRSVRDAFWRGELRFPDIHVAVEQHELLLRVLTALHGGRTGVGECGIDLFDGHSMFWRFYRCWLASIGLIDVGPNRLNTSVSAFEAPLTDEGRSVMMMLQATRDPEFEALPMAAVVDAVLAAGRGQADDDREATLRVFERNVAGRRHVFAREKIGTTHLVTLTGIGVGPGARMPVRRVMWSQSFKDAVVRDDLFAWLAARIDRWDNWGEMAYRQGADALTRHLFAVHIAGSRDAS